MKLVYLLFLFILFTSEVMPLTKKTSDDISASNSYFYRLAERALVIAPEIFYTDNFKPVSYREVSVLFHQDKNYSRLFGLPEENLRVFMDRVNKLYNFEDNYKDYASFVPLKFVGMSFLYSDKKRAEYTGSFGKRAYKNYYADFSGYGFGYIKDHVLGAYEIKVKYSEETDIEVSRFRIKKGFKHLGLELMKDNVIIGPGYFGQLLESSNIEPEVTAILKTEVPYSLGFLGSFRLYLWNSWIDDDDRPRSDPSLLGMRLSLKPSKYLEIGLNRTVFYGGDGNHEFNTLRDYWKLFTAEDENMPGGKLDTDQHFGLDMSIYVPHVRYISPFEGMKLYLESAWNDITAPWQREDRGKNFALLGDSYISGLLLSKKDLDIRFEWAKIYRETYLHHNYPEGYTDNDYLIGHFIGRDASMLAAEVYYEINGDFHVYFGGQFIKRNLKQDDKQKESRTYLGSRAFFAKNLIFDGKLTYVDKDKINFYDAPVNYRFITKPERTYTLNVEFSYVF